MRLALADCPAGSGTGGLREMPRHAAPGQRQNENLKPSSRPSGARQNHSSEFHQIDDRPSAGRQRRAIEARLPAVMAIEPQPGASTINYHKSRIRPVNLGMSVPKRRHGTQLNVVASPTLWVSAVTMFCRPHRLRRMKLKPPVPPSQRNPSHPFCISPWSPPLRDNPVPSTLLCNQQHPFSGD